MFVCLFGIGEDLDVLPFLFDDILQYHRCINMEQTLTIYIVGYEASPIHGGTSTFNWWRNKEIANTDYFDTVKTFINSDQKVYRGQLEVTTDFEDGTDEQIDQITDKVEEYLESNDWENSFKNSFKKI